MTNNQQLSNKKLVVFDMDDTLIINNTWMDFNVFMGMTADEDYALYKEFSGGSMTYLQWNDALTEHYRRHPAKTRSEIETQLGKSTIISGAAEAVQAAKQQGMQTALVTGSFDITAKQVASKLDIDEMIANTSIEYDADGLFKNLQSAGDQAQGKLTALTSLCQKYFLQPADCIAIGDGANDIPLFQAVGVGITFSNASAETQAAATHIIKDLTELPALLASL